MLEKIVVLFILFALLFAYDGPRLKQMEAREKLTYGALMLIALYFSVDYVSNLDLPRVHKVVVYLLSDPAERINSYFKAGIS